MPRLAVFNSVSLDGYFTDAKGDMSWAHNTHPDAEWDAFVAGNAQGGGRLVFGRITYELMAGYWPTPMAAKNTPAVAEHMNRLSKIVFSRTLDQASWNNTRLIKGDMVAEVRKLKKESGDDMVILGSGNIISQLAQEGLIDEYQIVVAPIVLGKGRTIFDGVTRKLRLKLTKSQGFANGNVVLVYEPTA
jgi:dihydrofolate reductase